jgi:hypothetical protein
MSLCFTAEKRGSVEEGSEMADIKHMTSRNTHLSASNADKSPLAFCTILQTSFLGLN